MVESNVKIPTPEEEYDEFMERLENSSLLKQILLPLFVFWTALHPYPRWGMTPAKIAAATDFYLNFFKKLAKKLKSIF